MRQSHTSGLPQTPIERFLEPFERFLRVESSGGIVLLAATIAALLWANLPGGATSYHHVWETAAGFTVAGLQFSMSLSHWINDSLMGVFFFVVGLEIKREIVAGELRSIRSALLPIAAAAGGMAVPALIYVSINAGGPAANGWGVPMATDIAFAIGVMALIGKRAPLPLKVFITALAIVDDLGAVLVIALFYTQAIQWYALAVAAALFAVMFCLNALGVRSAGAYAIVGLGMWFALLDSGIHATLAGVLSALAIPVQRRIGGAEFVERGREYLDGYARAAGGTTQRIPNDAQVAAMEGLEATVDAAHSPVSRLERLLHPWVMYVIMPVFALSNAGIVFFGSSGPASSLGFWNAFAQPAAVGVFLGLFVGKPLGIFVASWAVVASGLARRPQGIGWIELLGAGSLAGIGFTMSLFIADLGLESEPFLTEAKIGFLLASILSGIAGSLILSAGASRRYSPDNRRGRSGQQT